MTSGKPRRVLDAVTLQKATNEVAALAREHGTRVALVGGFALYLYGSDRLTGDVDVVASRWVEGLPHGSPLSFGGESTETASGVPIDVIVRSDEYVDLYEEALETASIPGDLPRLETDPDVVPTIVVVRPEYIVAMKMAAYRPKDRADLDFMIRNDTADWKKAHDVVRRFLGRFAARELDALVAETKWRAEKE
jgi:hypothetical protein